VTGAADGRHWLRRLDVRDFRNLAHVAIDPPADGIAVVGDNGQGKSNLLEAIYYLHLLRSARGARDVDVVRFGAPGFHVGATVDVDGAVGVGFELAGRRKRVTVDGVAPARFSDALGALPAVLFSPSDVALVRGAPAERRRYLDVMLGVTHRPYLRALQAYRAALAQRGAALRSSAAGRVSGRAGGGASTAAFTVWDAPLAEHGATLVRERAAWVARTADPVAALCAAIGEQGAIRLAYTSQFAAESDPGAAIADALVRSRASDLARGVTGAGPHRDDLSLTLDGRDLRAFGSAGQQRTAAIALRLVEAGTLRDVDGRAPLFLLDDPFAELDARRAHRILDVVRARGLGQTVLAVPRPTDIPPELTRLERWTIRDGILARSAA
jgi:DNA replication and repair protein RecF